MLGLLKKLLPTKKEMPPLSGRDLHGRNNVGYPTMQISREIDNLVKTQYKAIKPIINQYKDTLFFKWGPSVINDKLNDEQLANLSGRNLQMVYLLLFRDMLRYISELVTLKNVPENWPDVLPKQYWIIVVCLVMMMIKILRRNSNYLLILNVIQWMHLLMKKILTIPTFLIGQCLLPN